MTTSSKKTDCNEAAQMARFVKFARRYSETNPMTARIAMKAVRAMERAQLNGDWSPRWRQHPAVLRFVKEVWMRRGTL